jgi:hypothetical protein
MLIAISFDSINCEEGCGNDCSTILIDNKKWKLLGEQIDKLEDKNILYYEENNSCGAHGCILQYDFSEIYSHAVETNNFHLSYIANDEWFIKLFKKHVKQYLNDDNQIFYDNNKVSKNDLNTLKQILKILISIKEDCNILYNKYIEINRRYIDEIKSLKLTEINEDDSDEDKNNEDEDENENNKDE